VRVRETALERQTGQAALARRTAQVQQTVLERRERRQTEPLLGEAWARFQPAAR
jgi:hypothetical protein